MNAFDPVTRPNGDKSTAVVSQERLVADFQRVLADAEAVIKQSAAHGGERIEELRDQAKDVIKRVNTSMTETQQAVVARTREAAKATDTYVHDHPWQSIAATVGNGLLIGVLLARR